MEMSASISKPIQAKTMAELLPCLSGILSQDSIQSLTTKKQPRPKIFQTRTAEKVAKPLTIAEMRADMLALKVQSPKRFNQETSASTKKRAWNSSVKVDKKISHTANGQMKNNPVRKVLNFPKPKPPPNPRFTMINTETPKFPKPESRAKKSLHLQAKASVRISGVFNMPETPSLSNIPRNRVTIANKENISSFANSRKSVLPKPLPPRRFIPPPVPDTPASNDSWKSSCDNSFLQNEKEINDEEKIRSATTKTIANNEKMSQTASTPFKNYRNVQEYFNNSSCDTSLTKDLLVSENNKREESVIVSLCELLSKATVSQNKNLNTELDELLQLQKQTEHTIKNIENVIEVLKAMRETEIKSLESVKKIISEKSSSQSDGSEDHNNTLVAETTIAEVSPEITEPATDVSPKLSPVVGRAFSVIRSSPKSPTYKIPKKNAPLRKKVFHKSMPSVLARTPKTPPNDNKAIAMYMKIKEQMDFLKTPVTKQRQCDKQSVLNTPTMTSRNLQMQLDKLFGESQD